METIIFIVNFLMGLLLSLFISFGISILLTKKGNDYPIKKIRVIIQQFLHDYIGWKFAQVLYCSVCTIFWIMFFTDLLMFIITGGTYFFWPFSGVIGAGLTWITMEIISGINKEPIQLNFNKDE
jgi:hypothetical protein